MPTGDRQEMSDHDLLVRIDERVEAQSERQAKTERALIGEDGTGGLVAVVVEQGSRLSQVEKDIVGTEQKAEAAQDLARQAGAAAARKMSLPPKSRTSSAIRAAWIGGLATIIAAGIAAASML